MVFQIITFVDNRGTSVSQRKKRTSQLSGITRGELRQQRILRPFDPPGREKRGKQAGTVTYLRVALAADVVSDFGKQSTIELQILEASPYIAHPVETVCNRLTFSASQYRRVSREIVKRDVTSQYLITKVRRDAFVIITVAGYVASPAWRYA